MHYNDQGADFKYLIVNERDKRFGLSVTTVGFQAIRAGSVYPPRNHPDAYYFTAQKGRVLHEYQLVYITKGRGTFASDTTPSVDISKGQILFLFPGQWHTYAPLQKTGWNEYYIGFEGPIIDNLVKNSFISKESQILDIGINEELASLFARALEVAEADKTAAQQYLSGIVLHIMGAVLAISQNKRYEVDNAAQKIESAKIIMHENVYKDIDPEELAMKLGISYSWFRKVFKEYTGYAPAKYFQELKLRKAKQLIERLEAENIPLFLSGHLHVQHFMRREDGRGIYEIVTSSLTTPPCQYGVLEYRDDESFSYYTRQVDMEKWARRHQSTDENLINFNTYSKTALKNIFYNQAYDAMKNSRQEEKGDLFVKLTEEQKKAMAEVYSRMSTAWYAGKGYEAVKGAVEDPGFKMWQEFCYPAVLYEYLEYMTADSVRDYNKLQSE